MDIVLVGGGLGNQTFQYIFARYIELSTKRECWLNDMAFTGEKVEHHGYELEKVFGVKPKLLSKCFSEDVWEAMRELARKGNSMPQILKDYGLDLMVIDEVGEVKFDGNILRAPINQYSPYVSNVTNGNVYYHGYWINKHWLEEYKETLLNELSFPEITDAKNLRYMNGIKESFSVGVHVRRGDFVTLGWELSTEYYYQAMKTFSEKFKNAKYFIFSDDIDWCKAHEKELGFEFANGNIEYVTGNVGGVNYIDMQLLSMCKGMIIANSSFSYLAALLNTVPGKIVANPTAREI